MNKIMITDEKHGWLKLKFINQERSIDIWLSNEFDPFEDIFNLIKDLEKRKDSKILINEEGEEKEINITFYDKNDTFIIKIVNHGNNKMLYCSNYNTEKFINNIKSEIINIKNNIKKTKNFFYWKDSSLYKKKWKKSL